MELTESIVLEFMNQEAGGRLQASPPHGALAPGAGDGEAGPLILIEEHLTDNFLESLYQPAFSQGYLLENWMVESGYTAPPDGEKTPVLKVQKFEAGGYEATVRMLDLAKIGRAMNRAHRRGKREDPGERDPDSVRKAGARAKRRVRHLVKNMGATNLVTLTRRESAEDVEAGRSWTAEQWASAWDRLRRCLVRVIGEFPYVAVLEQHAKGNFHLHVAWVGKVNLNIMRPLWWAIAGGRGQGNVHSQYIKVSRGCARSAVIARYISKYVTKHFEEEGRFNKKRYWASRQDMPAIKRYILNCPDAIEALKERYELMDINLTDRHNFFLFPDGSGWWWNFIPDIHASPPPF